MKFSITIKLPSDVAIVRDAVFVLTEKNENHENVNKKMWKVYIKRKGT